MSTRVAQFICKPYLISTDEEYGLCVLVLSTDVYGTFHLDALFHMAPRLLTITTPVTTTATTMKQRKSFKEANYKRLLAELTMWTTCQILSVI